MPSDRVRHNLRKNKKPETLQAEIKIVQNSGDVGSVPVQTPVDSKAPFNPTPL